MTVFNCHIYNNTVFGIIIWVITQHKFYWLLGECYCEHCKKKSQDIIKKYIIIIMMKSGKNYISFDNICLFFFPCRRLPASWVGFCSISVDTCRVRLQEFCFLFLFKITFNLSKVWFLRNYHGVLIVVKWNKKNCSFINHLGTG